MVPAGVVVVAKVVAVVVAVPTEHDERDVIAPVIVQDVISFSNPAPLTVITCPTTPTVADKTIFGKTSNEANPVSVGEPADGQLTVIV